MGNTQDSRVSGQMRYPSLSPYPLATVVNVPHRKMSDRTPLYLNNSQTMNSVQCKRYQELDLMSSDDHILDIIHSSTSTTTGQDHHQQKLEQALHVQSSSSGRRTLTEAKNQQSSGIVKSHQSFKESTSSSMVDLDINDSCKINENKDNSSVLYEDMVHKKKITNLEKIDDSCISCEKTNDTPMLSALDVSMKGKELSNIVCEEDEQPQLVPTVFVSELLINEPFFEEMTEADQGAKFLLQEDGDTLKENGSLFESKVQNIECCKSLDVLVDDFFRLDVPCKDEPFLDEILDKNSVRRQGSIDATQKIGEACGLIEITRQSVFMDTTTGDCFTMFYGSFNGDGTLSPSDAENALHSHMFRSNSSTSDTEKKLHGQPYRLDSGISDTEKTLDGRRYRLDSGISDTEKTLHSPMLRSASSISDTGRTQHGQIYRLDSGISDTEKTLHSPMLRSASSISDAERTQHGQRYRLDSGISDTEKTLHSPMFRSNSSISNAERTQHGQRYRLDSGISDTEKTLDGQRYRLDSNTSDLERSLQGQSYEPNSSDNLSNKINKSIGCSFPSKSYSSQHVSSTASNFNASSDNDFLFGGNIQPCVAADSAQMYPCDQAFQTGSCRMDSDKLKSFFDKMNPLHDDDVCSQSHQLMDQNCVSDRLSQTYPGISTLNLDSKVEQKTDIHRIEFQCCGDSQTTLDVVKCTTVCLACSFHLQSDAAQKQSGVAQSSHDHNSEQVQDRRRKLYQNRRGFSVDCINDTTSTSRSVKAHKLTNCAICQGSVHAQFEAAEFLQTSFCSNKGTVNNDLKRSNSAVCGMTLPRPTLQDELEKAHTCMQNSQIHNQRTYRSLSHCPLNDANKCANLSKSLTKSENFGETRRDNRQNNCSSHLAAISCDATNKGDQKYFSYNDRDPGYGTSQNDSNGAIGGSISNFPGTTYRQSVKNYAAYLCCAEDTLSPFGLPFHDMLEKWGFPICIEPRDLELTGPKYDNMARCVEERCNGKIIVVLSSSYAQSEECLFLTFFAKTLDPDSRKKNIIPVAIDKDVEIPSVLLGLSIINYNHLFRCGWLKHKLANAIAA